jgi:hypothetical protein
MRKLLTFFKTQNPRRERQGLAGGWLEARRRWSRCQAKDPLDPNAVPGFLQAHLLSIGQPLCTTLLIGAIAFGMCSPASTQIVGGGIWGGVKPRAFTKAPAISGDRCLDLGKLHTDLQSPQCLACVCIYSRAKDRGFTVGERGFRTADCSTPKIKLDRHTDNAREQHAARQDQDV